MFDRQRGNLNEPVPSRCRLFCETKQMLDDLQRRPWRELVRVLKTRPVRTPIPGTYCTGGCNNS
jgi:hypothetical protein